MPSAKVGTPIIYNHKQQNLKVNKSMMTRKQLQGYLDSLSKRRTIFHSEADFQHELAIELVGNGWDCRLEWPMCLKIKNNSVDVKIDLLARKKNASVSGNASSCWVAIELKYVTSKFSLSIGGEQFDLSENWGTNLSRFDCLADLEKVESLVNAGKAIKGFTVFLTNKSATWSKDVSNTNNLGKNFSIHDGRELGNQPLNWNPINPSSTSIGNKRLNQYSPVNIQNSQKCDWMNYGKLKSISNNVFKSLILET